MPAHIPSCSRVLLAATSGDSQPSALASPWTLVAQNPEAEVPWWTAPAPRCCTQPGPSCCTSLQLHRSIFWSAGPGGNKDEVVKGPRHGLGVRHGDMALKGVVRHAVGAQAWDAALSCQDGPFLSMTVILEYQPPFLGLLSRALSHGTVSSRSLKRTKPALLKSSTVILIFA